MFNGHPCLGDPAPSPLHQLERVPRSFLWRHLRKRVSTEMSLHVLAYNIKRVIAIIGVGPLLQAIRA